MLCSIPTSRSSPGWLDRLHASKGFAISDNLDLDNFLHSVSNPNSTPNRNPVAPPPCVKKMQSQKKIFFEKEQRLFDLMSDVLSELFVMGDSRDSAAGLKGARKQVNPRPCIPSASASADGVASAISPSSADNSIADAKMDRKKMKRMRANSGSDPLMCSGTVVTVIDTSLLGWKTEKHFRKGMAWKGREKKVWNVSRKKRKLDLVEKFIAEKERLRPLDELKGGEPIQNADSQNEVCTGNINWESAKESDYHMQNPKRPKFLRSPRLPVKNSSLFRLQVINRSPKSGLSVIRGTLKGKP